MAAVRNTRRNTAGGRGHDPEERGAALCGPERQPGARQRPQAGPAARAALPRGGYSPLPPCPAGLALRRAAVAAAAPLAATPHRVRRLPAPPPPPPRPRRQNTPRHSQDTPLPARPRPASAGYAHSKAQPAYRCRPPASGHAPSTHQATPPPPLWASGAGPARPPRRLGDPRGPRGTPGSRGPPGTAPPVPQGQALGATAG